MSNIPKSLRDRLAATTAALAPKPKFDSVAIYDAAADYTAHDCKLKAAGVIQEWAAGGSEGMDEGETAADRLFAMMVGCVDADANGEFSDEENEALAEFLEAGYDYLESKGVDSADIDALLNNGDNDAAERVIEMLSGGMAELDDEGMAADMDQFAFGEEVAMDAAYKKVTAFRKGRKVRINKRVSGVVRLSAAQKMAIRKATRRAGSARAMMRRAKTNRMRKKSGM